MKTKREADFSRLRKALLCGEPDHVPLVEFTIDKKIKEQFLGRSIRGVGDEVDFWSRAGYDFIRLRPSYEFPKVYASDDNRSPGRKWAQEGIGLITNEDEFRKYTWLDPDKDVGYSTLVDASKILNPGMRMVGAVNGIFENVTQIMGFEEFCVSIKGNPRLVEKMFARVGEIIFEIFRLTSKVDNIGAMVSFEDIAYSRGLMVSPSFLRKQLFPWTRKMADLCHELDIPFIFHSDGDISAVLDDLAEMGVNAIHPLEPEAMDVYEVKSKYRGRLCVCGSIDLGTTLTRGTPEDVWSEVEEKVRRLRSGGGFCVGSSNSIPDYVPIENYRALIEASLYYG